MEDRKGKKMAENFRRAAMEIDKAFQSDNYGRKWIEMTNRGGLANEILSQMINAKNKNQFDKACFRWSREILYPYYDNVVAPRGTEREIERFEKSNPLLFMAGLPKVPSYQELKKHGAFAESPHLVQALDERGNRLYNKDGSPKMEVSPLRSVRNPGVLRRAAHSLGGLRPEDLRDIVENRFNEHQRMIARNAQEDADKRLQEIRSNYADNFARNMIDPQRYPIAAKIFNPTLGFLGNAFARPIMKEYQDALRQGRDPEYGRMKIPQTLATGVASSYVPGKLASKLVPLMAPGAGAAAQSFLDAGIQGLADGGIELARQRMMGEPLSFNNAWEVGKTSATIPAGVGAIGGFLGQFGGSRRFIGPIMRQMRGAMETPASAEAQAAKEIFQDAKQASKMKGVDNIERYGINRDLDRATQFINQSGRSGNQINVNDLRKMIKDGSAKPYFNPPSRSEFNVASPQSWEKMTTQWPQNFDEMTRTPSRVQKLLGQGANAVATGAARKETAESHWNPALYASPELLNLMKSNPEIIDAWDRGYFTKLGDGVTDNPLYLEYKATFKKDQ